MAKGSSRRRVGWSGLATYPTAVTVNHSKARRTRQVVDTGLALRVSLSGSLSGLTSNSALILNVRFFIFCKGFLPPKNPNWAANINIRKVTIAHIDIDRQTDRQVDRQFWNTIFWPWLVMQSKLTNTSSLLETFLLSVLARLLSTAGEILQEHEVALS